LISVSELCGMSYSDLQSLWAILLKRRNTFRHDKPLPYHWIHYLFIRCQWKA